jgi:uncharacterized short protein YbdD (DUF466 family)
MRLTMDFLRTAYKWAAQAARLMVGVPDYETYVEHRRAEHPDEPVMTYEQFYQNRLKARYTIDKDRLRGCC